MEEKSANQPPTFAAFVIIKSFTDTRAHFRLLFVILKMLSVFFPFVLSTFINLFLAIHKNLHAKEHQSGEEVATLPLLLLIYGFHFFLWKETMLQRLVFLLIVLLIQSSFLFEISSALQVSKSHQIYNTSLCVCPLFRQKKQRIFVSMLLIIKN